MNCKLFASELLCAALLLGCSSAPKLALPSGQWSYVDLPSAVPPATTASTTPLPAYPASTPINPAKAPWASAAASPTHSASPPASTAVRPLSGNLSASVPPAPQNVATAQKGASNAVGTQTTAAAPFVASTSVVTPPKTAVVPTVATPKIFPSAAPQPVVSVVAPVAKPLKPTPIPKPVWEARVGDSLRSVIKGWSQRASYTMAWEAEDLDYSIDAPLRFEGTYEEAVAAIFQLYEKADRSFKVDGRRAQHRLNVSEDHNKSKRAPL